MRSPILYEFKFPWALVRHASDDLDIASLRSLTLEDGAEKEDNLPVRGPEWSLDAFLHIGEFPRLAPIGLHHEDLHPWFILLAQTIGEEKDGLPIWGPSGMAVDDVAECKLFRLLLIQVEEPYVAVIEVELVKVTVSAGVIAPLVLIASTVGIETKLVPAIVTSV